MKAASLPNPADVLPIDVATIRATIGRALDIGPAPSRADLVELEQLLRGHVQLLLPIAETAVGRLDRGTVDWWERRTRLSAVAETLRHGLGDGMLSARVQVTNLARDCRALLSYTPAG